LPSLLRDAPRMWRGKTRTLDFGNVEEPFAMDPKLPIRSRRIGSNILALTQRGAMFDDPSPPSQGARYRYHLGTDGQTLGDIDDEE
jgi:hypothetical protein